MPTGRRTKIVATIGPACSDPSVLDGLIAAGMDVARLNFSHGSPEQHRKNCELVRERAEAAGRMVGVLVDTPGPKMRSGVVGNGEVDIQEGSRFDLVNDDVVGDQERVSTTTERLNDYVGPGDEIFLADGEILLEVAATSPDGVQTTVLRGGTLGSRKGMHIPAIEQRITGITAGDKNALVAALEMRADIVALSFVRTASDIEEARSLIRKNKKRNPLVVAKIETRSAVTGLDDIIAAADGVMVARGDLGIQLPLRTIPVLQKQIIGACNRAGKPVITATEMLESMIHEPLPTRAEATDVANAVLDGTDAVMLSAETAVGEHPVEAVATMADLAGYADGYATTYEVPAQHDPKSDSVSWAVSHAGVQAATEGGATAILCPTQTGATPRRVAAFRPPVPVIAISTRRETCGAAALSWGVTPILVKKDPAAANMNEEVDRALAFARDAGVISSGDLVAVVAGSPGPRAGATDFLRVVRA